MRGITDTVKHLLIINVLMFIAKITKIYDVFIGFYCKKAKKIYIKNIFVNLLTFFA